MKTEDLKRILIDRISKINDKSLLEVINTILKSDSESIIYKTTPQQRKRISEGKAQIEKCEYFTEEQVKNEIDQWLNQK